jgi:hypothetical protein
VHETVFVCQCVGEVGTDRPEVYSAAKCSVVAYSLVFISEVVSCTDYPVFQEVIFGADSCLKLADFGRKQIVEVECHLQTVLHAEWQVDCTSQA